jgi:hypothetical protein
MTMQRVLTVICLALTLGGVSTPADAAPSRKKAIWGPAQVNGASQFPIYRDLGAGIWQTRVSWAAVAPTRPAAPTNPGDPAYRWPAELDAAVADASRSGIAVAITLSDAPGWANGGRARQWAPRNPRDFANFAAAASRRYPGVRHWLIWGEPSRAGNFEPLPPGRATGPRAYARILDAAYGSLKSVNRGNLVIGGNTFTVGAVSPLAWLRFMRLPGGRPPRLDLYGHNPFTRRVPRLGDGLLNGRYVDFGGLDTLAARLDDQYPRARKGLFLSEFSVPTGKPNRIFNFFTSEQEAATIIGAGYRVARRYPRVYTLGYFSLYDEPAMPGGGEALWGLIDSNGRRKPGYAAYRGG